MLLLPELSLPHLLCYTDSRKGVVHFPYEFEVFAISLLDNNLQKAYLALIYLLFQLSVNYRLSLLRGRSAPLEIWREDSKPPANRVQELNVYAFGFDAYGLDGLMYNNRDDAGWITYLYELGILPLCRLFRLYAEIIYSPEDTILLTSWNITANKGSNDSLNIISYAFRTSSPKLFPPILHYFIYFIFQFKHPKTISLILKCLVSLYF